MNRRAIIVVLGEPYSVFLEIFFKIFKSNYFSNFKKPIILIGSEKLLKGQMKKLGYDIKINLLKNNDLKKIKIKKKFINLVNVDFYHTKSFDKITYKSKNYIEKCFFIGLDLIKKKNRLLIN